MEKLLDKNANNAIVLDSGMCGVEVQIQVMSVR